MRSGKKQDEQLRPVRVGCSGWNYKSWRGELYPPGLPARRWLERYAELFDTVEVNTTFYRLVSRDAVQRWVQQTPPDFCFAVKGSRYLTHVKRLANIREGLARFYERIEPLIEAKRLGPVLWQLPETFHRDDERLAGIRDLYLLQQRLGDIRAPQRRGAPPATRPDLRLEQDLECALFLFLESPFQPLLAAVPPCRR